MKYCAKCKTQYGDDLDVCPSDGVLLKESSSPGGPQETMTIAEAGNGVPENTAKIAGELEDLIFKVCSKCHLSYGGEIDVCPEDGTRLNERSMLGRDTLSAGALGVTGSIVELKKYCPKCKGHYPLHQKSCERCGSALVIPTQGAGPLKPAVFDQMGLVIADKYRLIRDIGAGGFGSVYLAKHEALGKQFAVKVLRSHLSGDTSFQDRFHEEALKLSRLEDENIVKVIDFGEWKDFQYMVTEYVEGKDLSKVIYEEKLEPLRAAKLLCQVAGALAEAHSKKIVHLDLKPANILVGQKRGRDTVKVIDFGIAEIFSDSRGRRQETICGTCTYMAPEQWRMENLDPRTDIYSFGIILYECLAARPPFRHQWVTEYEVSHREIPPPPLRKIRPDVPAELEKLVYRCLEKDPAKRVQSAEVLEDSLQRYVRRTENVLGRWLKICGAAAALLALCGAAVWAFLEARRDKESPTWGTWTVTSKGTPLREVSASGAVKRFRTREEKVQVQLEARDDRGVERMVATSGAWEGYKRLAGSPEPIELELAPGNTQLTVQAFDRSGNSTPPLWVTIERLPPIPSHPISAPPAPRTNKSEAVLSIDAAAEAKATVECRNGDQVVSTAEADLKPDEPTSLAARLKPGENTLLVRIRDLLTGEERPAQEFKVWCEPRPLRVEPTVIPLGRKALKLESPGTWLSQGSEVLLDVRVPDAKARLDPGSRFQVQVNGKIPLLSCQWEVKDLDAGKLSLRIDLDEGKNEISIAELKDHYGNASQAMKIEVDCDPNPPTIELEANAVECYAEDLPSVRFRVTDRNPAQAEKGLSLIGASEEQVDPRSYRVRRSDDGPLEIQFLDEAILREDGPHRFRIAARDRIGNETGKEAGRFTVLSDHQAPEITIQGPVSGKAFRKNESIDLSAQVRDAFVEGLQVEAAASVTAPGFKAEKKLAMAPVQGTWKVAIPITRAGLEKPGAFDELRPTFEVTVRATDRAGHASSSTLHLDFAWENGDRLLWKDGSVLVHHDTCRAQIGDVPPFWMARTEVTNRQFARFLEAQGGTYDLGKAFWTSEARRLLKGTAGPRSPDWKDGRCPADKMDLPVRGISFLEMEAYARWAGLEVPRRSQWLVAAYWSYDPPRNRRYPWEGAWPSGGPSPVRAGKTSPISVGEKAGVIVPGSTPFGLEHMLGNVWEMVLDASGKAVRVGGGYDTDEKVFRDEKYASYLRGELGQPISAEEFNDSLGFRCVLGAKGNRP